MSKSVDHYPIPASRCTNPLDRSNLRLAHYGPCNSSPGQKLTRTRILRRSSRQW